MATKQGNKVRKISSQWLDSYGDGGKTKGLFDDKYEQLVQKGTSYLQELYPGKKVEIRQVSGDRDISGQAALKKKGASQTNISLHNAGAARDFNIFVDGKFIPNTNYEVYKNTLWSAANDLGMYHLSDDAPSEQNPKPFGRVDPYHISVVKETDDHTAYKRLINEYPEVMDTPTFKKTEAYLEKNAGNDPIMQMVYGQIQDARRLPVKQVSTTPYTWSPTPNIATRGDGGKALAPEDAAIAKVLMERNRGKNFVDRAFDYNNSPSIQNPDGSHSSHLMAYDRTRVYPTIVQMHDGSLQKLGDDEAWDYADESGEYINTPTEKIADMLSNYGYKKATGMPTFGDGGRTKPIEYTSDANKQRAVVTTNEMIPQPIIYNPLNHMGGLDLTNQHIGITPDVIPGLQKQNTPQHQRWNDQANENRKEDAMWNSPQVEGISKILNAGLIAEGAGFAEKAADEILVAGKHAFLPETVFSRALPDRLKRWSKRSVPLVPTVSPNTDSHRNEGKIGKQSTNWLDQY